MVPEPFQKAGADRFAIYASIVSIILVVTTNFVVEVKTGNLGAA